MLDDRPDPATDPATDAASPAAHAPSSSSGPVVVVAYDGSSSSATALGWAAKEAGALGASLRVLFAADLEGADVGGAALLARAVLEAGERVADEGAAWTRGIEGAPARDLVEIDVRSGRPVRALVAASRDADVLVVGNRGRGTIAGALLGSVAYSVTAQAACPVVVVRGDPEHRPGPGHPVVLGVDGSEGAAPATAFAAGVAARAGAPLVVLAAWTPPDVVNTGGAHGASYVADLTTRAEDAARRSADDVLAWVREAHPDLAGEVQVVRERPAQALVAASSGAGLVVVGARGRGSVGGLFLGSVSHATVHGAACPVAVVRRLDQR